MLLWRRSLTWSWRLQETLPNGSWHCVVTAAARPDPVARNSFILLPFQDARSPTQQPASEPLAQCAHTCNHGGQCCNSRPALERQAYGNRVLVGFYLAMPFCT